MSLIGKQTAGTAYDDQVDTGSPGETGQMRDSPSVLCGISLKAAPVSADDDISFLQILFIQKKQVFFKNPGSEVRRVP